MADAPTRSVYSPNMAGYNAWVKPILELAPKMFEGYADALALIAQRREAMRQADITGPMGRTAGWSPGGNFKMDAEFPYVASLLLKAAFGIDALTNRAKRHFILKLHPEFSYKNLRR